jgi:hypothetical protein
MKTRAGRTIPGIVLALALLVPAAAGAQVIPNPCILDDPTPLPSGARARICVPQSGWNRQLVVYAPGYVPPRPAPLPPVVPPVRNLDINGLSLPLLVQSQGFAFATTGYRQDGLAILEGADDIRELVARFKSQHGAPE